MEQNIIKIEWVDEDKITIDRESFKVVMEAVFEATANIVIPESVDRKNNPMVQLVTVTLATIHMLSEMALFDPETFVNDVLNRMKNIKGEVAYEEEKERWYA